MTLIEYNKLTFEIYEHFRKGSALARYALAGPNGRMLLSIPVLHEHRGRTPVSRLRIQNRDGWQLVHWRTLTSAYRRSPWFEYYEDELRFLYTEPFELLTDFSRAAFDLVTKWLNVSWEVSFTETFREYYPEAEVDDRRYLAMPRQEAPALDGEPVRYRQVFEDRIGFIPGLSILDLLFSEGKCAASLLGTDR